MPTKRLLSPPPSSPPLSTAVSDSDANLNTSTTPLPFPNFLNLSRPQILLKFRLLAAHETTIATTPSAFITHAPDTLSRDRYADIRPWAHNRIQLSSFEEPHDYINASPITLGRPKERFIATQGPADDEHGLEGFWRMVQQEGVQVVVMLTRCVEGGREKCGAYFPLEEGDKIQIEGWGRVECVGKKVRWGSEVRELRVVRVKFKETEMEAEMEGEDEVGEQQQEEWVEVEEEAMTVWHYLFLAWPDMDVPKTAEDQKALLELISMTREKIQDNSSPRIVHCSAGVGRTGTFIALDHLLQEFNEGKWEGLVSAKPGDGGGSDWDPVFDTVKKLRDQRMGLVYKVGQYAFIYQILREKWEEKYAVKMQMQTPGGASVEDGVVERETVILESPAKRRRTFSDGSGLDGGN